MNLYHISQTANDSYDTYDSAIVAAESEEEAANIHPDGRVDWGNKVDWYNTWCKTRDQVTVKRIGLASVSVEKGVILASFNAG